VFIEAEGKEDDINKLIEWCYVGSPRSQVKEVIAEEGEVKSFETFEVKK
jgi:acylphosphatase